MTSIKPIGKYVLLQLSPVYDTSKGGIYLGTEKREQSGTIIAIGPQVKDVKVGEKIHFQLGDFKKVTFGDTVANKTEYAMVLEDHIVGVYEN